MSKTTRYRDPHQWSRSRDHLDPEKASPPMTYDSSLSDDEPVYSDTSRTTSGSLSSHVPMLPSPSRRRRPRRNGIMRNGIMPHRLMRFVCMAVFFALVVFVLNLFRFTLFGRADQVPIDVAKSAPKPHVWESFPFLKRYHGGIRSLVPRNDSVPEYPGDGTLDQLTLSMEEALQQSGEGSDQQGEEEEARKTVQKRSDRLPMASSAFNPYPDYESEEYIQKFGQKVECFLDEDGQVRMPYLHYYPGVPQGFPDAIMGSNEMLGIRDDVCFDRFGRLGPYGLGYGARKGGSGAAMEGDREGSERVWADVPPVDFREVNWAAAQNRCAIANSHRFAKLGDTRLDSAFTMPIGAPPKSHLKIPPAPEETDASGTHHLPRTAVLIRTWHDFPYTEEDILYLRALITELSLMTGGEFTVLFLIHVKDDNLQIWSDEETYDRVLSEALPEEFRGMGILWSERQMNLIYGGLQESFERGLPVHGVYRSTFMPVQYFSHLHPEYDYVWNWEMDVRHTGHWYHFFDKAASWARKQPRKGLWERNSRFYVPSVHGPWEDFMQTVRVQTELGTNTPNNIWSAVKDSEDKSDPNHKDHGRHGEDFIWGPTRPREEDILELETDVIPPTSMEKDRYDWGVGEEADLIVFNPLFDPVGTTWLLRNDVTGYNREDDAPERRAAIITASRLSRKLLMTMHRETSMKRHTMFSEMWPATTALHHGLKAVYVPHSVYIDRKWPTRYVEAVFNAGRNGATGGARTSVFGDREHNFRGTTWFYSAGFSSNLYRRWLGYKVDNDGGEEEELAGEGRLCLPPMLLHPVKDVQLVIDNGDVPDEGEVGESIADDSP